MNKRPPLLTLRAGRLPGAIAGCLLGCCLLLLAGWPLSYWRAASVFCARPDLALLVNRGSVVVSRPWDHQTDHGLVPEASAALLVPEFIDWGHDVGCVSVLGFGEAEGWICWCPVWFPASLMAVVPAVWLRRRRRAAGRGFPVEASSPAS